MTNTRSAFTKPLPPRTQRREKQQRKCAECGQTFSKTEHLARHIRSHTRERPFACENCGKTYTRHDSLLRHTRSHTSQSDGTSISVGMPDSTAVITSPAAQAINAESPANTACADAHSGNQVHAPALDPHCLPQPAAESEMDSRGLSSLSVSATTGDDVASGFADIGENMMSNSLDLGYRDLGLNPYEPGWLLGDDFDVDALNFSISAVISEWGPHVTTDSLEDRRMYTAADTLNRLQMPWPPAEATSRVQQEWYTRVSRAVSPQNSSQLPDQDFVDERYREGLSYRLQPRVSNAALPSADFLNLCIKLYLTKFNPLFPIIHAPTFRPSSESALLLLSICSVGALFIGSASATSQGRKIFQILNKAVLASWENYIRREGREPLSLAQAVIIGQTFGMLSGQPQDLCLTESFHGTIIAWARQAGLFKIRDSVPVLREDGSSNLETTWRRWVQAEESTRLILGLHIHDMEFATSFHHEPLLRHKVERLPVCSSEELFKASSAAQWQSLIRSRQYSDPVTISSFAENTDGFNSMIRGSHMFPYASLAGILASIQEAKTSCHNEESIHYFRDRLLAWYDDYEKLPKESKHNPMNLVVLWHMAFMCLYADLDLLERSFGRDGNLPAEQARYKVQIWASSSEARRGVLHALLVIKHMETLPIGVESAIHVPKVLFFSAIFAHCYIILGPDSNLCLPLQDEINNTEFQVSAPTSFSHHGTGRVLSSLFSPFDSSLLCSTIDLLRRLGHWGISQRYASILENLFDDFAKP